MRTAVHPTVARIAPEIERTLADFGCELVQIKLAGRPGRQTLTVRIDKPGGVTSGDCQYMGSRLSLLLDMLDPIHGSYSLIVSSPGVDRPLVKDKDFERFAGQQAQIRFGTAEGRKRTSVGRLDGLRGDSVVLETPQGTELIALGDIEAAKLIYDWEGEMGG